MDMQKILDALESIDGWWHLPNKDRTIKSIEPAIILVKEALAEFEGHK